MTSPVSDGSPNQLSHLNAAQQRELLARLLREKATRIRPAPMSLGQQGLWHAYRRDPLATPFNVYLPSRFRSPLDVEKLQKTFHAVVKWHPSLRTTFKDNSGELLQVVHDDLIPEFSVQEMAGRHQAEVEAIIAAETLRPFNLEQGPLIRLKLYKLAADDWIVLALTHHIIVDFWSLVVILRDMRAGLAADQSASPLLPPTNGATYVDFVREQTEFLASAIGQKHREYWREQASRGNHVLDLPTDYLRPSVFTGRAASVPLSFTPELSSVISSSARSFHSTTFSIVLAGLSVLLSRYSGQESFYIGSPFSCRRSQRYEQTVGFFVNMLPLLSQVDTRKSFSDLVRQTAGTISQALDKEMIPVAEIVRDAKVARDPSRSPLFQVSCTFEKSHIKEEAGRAGFLFQDQQLSWNFAGLKQENYYIPHATCHYDLEFVFEQGADRLRGQLLYCRDLFSRDSMQHMAANLSSLLESLLDNPHSPLAQVPWTRERRAFRLATHRDWNEFPSHVAPPSSAMNLPAMIVDASERLSQRSTALALKSATFNLTYPQLLSSALELAERLRAMGITAGSLIPLIANRGPLAMVGILAIQLAGAAVVPIDSAQPALTFEELVRQVRPRIVVVDSTSQLRGLKHDSDIVVLSRADCPVDAEMRPVDEQLLQLLNLINPHDPAYVIFTSGSTGIPKGVVVEHRAIANMLSWKQIATPLTSDDRVLMLLSHQFDAGLGIAWSTLTQGATVVWPDDVNIDPSKLIEQIQRDAITVLPAIPSLMKVIVAHPNFGDCHSLRYLWTGGEAMPVDLPEQIRQRSTARLWNFYGPTEAAVETTAIDVTDHPANRPISIGYPIIATQVLVLDDQHQSVPDTVPGQLAIAGVGLARGYLNDEARTAEAFIQASPSVSAVTERVYLTGDRGRKLADGSLEFLGRLDNQVKINGYRLELEEVELAIQSQPGILRCAAIALGTGLESTRLAAYFTCAEPLQAQPSTNDSVVAICDRLQHALRSNLPHYKVPTAWMCVDNFPLTASGKVDRKRLPAFNPILSSESKQHVAPRNSIEAFLASVWQEHLGCEVSVTANFFDCGGSSLQAAAVTSDMSRELGVDVPTTLLFDLADIETVAKYLCEHHAAAIGERFGSATIDDQLAISHGQKSQAKTLHPLINALKPSGQCVPLILIHPPGGIVACYRELAQNLPEEQPLFAIRSRGLFDEQERLPESLEEMAADYLSAIEASIGPGTYALGGWSLGGLVAYEMVRQRITAGRDVHSLILLDTTIPQGSTTLVPTAEQVNVGKEYGIELTLDQLGELAPEEQLPFLYEHAQRLGVLLDEAAPDVVAQTLRDLQRLFHHHVQLCRGYKLAPLPVPLHLIRPRDVPREVTAGSEDRGWRYLVQSVHVTFVPGHHHSMVQSPHVQYLGAALKCILES